MASDSLTQWVIVATDSPSGYMAAAIHRLQPAAWEHGGAMIRWPAMAGAARSRGAKHKTCQRSDGAG